VPTNIQRKGTTRSPLLGGYSRIQGSELSRQKDLKLLRKTVRMMDKGGETLWTDVRRSAGNLQNEERSLQLCFRARKAGYWGILRDHRVFSCGD
jgi:hypothetical protein